MSALNLHAATGYAIERPVRDHTLLSDVVRFDRNRLGDISGARTNQQCPLDTFSLARLGAEVSGLDFLGLGMKRRRPPKTTPSLPQRFRTIEELRP